MEQSSKQSGLSAEAQAMVHEALAQPGGQAGTVAFLTEKAKGAPEAFVELLSAIVAGEI